jgi:hypothetical protein
MTRLTAICREDEHSTHLNINSNGALNVPERLSRQWNLQIDADYICVATAGGSARLLNDEALPSTSSPVAGANDSDE